MTEPLDLHADAVIRLLNTRGVPVVRVHPEDLPHSMGVTVRAGGEGSVRAEVSFGGRSVRFDEIRAAWFRKPNLPDYSGHTHTSAERYCRIQAKCVLEALWQLIPDSKWICSPQSLTLAENKVLQLMAARDAGLTTPETILTNNPEEARRFFADVGGDMAVKAYTPEIMNDSERKVYKVPLTSRWTSSSDLADESIAISPTIYQPYIKKSVEIRAVVIGERVYAAEMHTQTNDLTEIDSRGTIDIRHERHILPRHVEDSLRKLVTHFDLRFSSADLILTPDNRYVFLDLNPNGQWLWLEHALGIPLSETMADLLCGVPRGET
ncbi:hypothetical protein [Rhizohabitans arisaemae]|uniref:hypothetical protein n=1 Tax=Rhizohabitans arisaemae TaxID=2720610 RepID=UPI0024B03CE2|nr:hypothetical protein [Rhizohabitans arisaemae]